MAELFDKNKRILNAYLIGVQTSRMPSGEGAELLAELRELVDTLGLAVAGSVIGIAAWCAVTFTLGAVLLLVLGLGIFLAGLGT